VDSNSRFTRFNLHRPTKPRGPQPLRQSAGVPQRRVPHCRPILPLPRGTPHGTPKLTPPPARGLHSSPSQLIVSTF